MLSHRLAFAVGYKFTVTVIKTDALNINQHITFARARSQDNAAVFDFVSVIRSTASLMGTIKPQAAVQFVIARTTRENVIANTTKQRVIARLTKQLIITTVTVSAF